MRQYILPIFGISFLLNCGISVAHAKTRAAREDDIREVLFRRLAPNRSAKPKQPAAKRSEFEPPEIKVYYFSIWSDGKYRDPSDQFLKRFLGNRPPIKKESQSYVDPNAKDRAWSQIKDKKTHELGMRFSIGRIKWLSRNRVSAQAGYEAGGINADYWLRFSSGHWRIIKVKSSPIS